VVNRNLTDEDKLAAIRLLQDRVAGLAPSERAAQLEYLKTQRPRTNAMGVTHAVDSLTLSPIVRRGVEEGYLRVGDDFRLIPNEGRAAELDEFDDTMRQAEQLGEELQARPVDPLAIDVTAKPVDDTAQVPAQVTEQVTEQAPDMPTQVMGETPPAQPSIADQFQAVNDLNRAVDEQATTNIQAKLDRIKDLLGELDQPLPQVTRGRKVKELKKLQAETKVEAPPAAVEAIDPLENTFVPVKANPEADYFKVEEWAQAKGIDINSVTPEEFDDLLQKYTVDELAEDYKVRELYGTNCDLSP
jgi:hypothetical protein